MEFINGVIFLKEVLVLSVVGSCILGTFVIIATVMMFGGARLYINGCRDFSDGKKIFGVIVCLIGIALSVSLSALSRSNTITYVFDNWGLTDHTGKYEVTTTADVDMNEFQDCYETIDYKNGVYTIKVRESGNFE